MSDILCNFCSKKFELEGQGNFSHTCDSFSATAKLFSHDECQAKYEALESRCQKLEAALARIKNCDVETDGRTILTHEAMSLLATKALAHEEGISERICI